MRHCIKYRYQNAKCVTFVNYRIRNELKEKQFFILYSVVYRMSNFVTLCLYLPERIYICSKLVLKSVIYAQLYRVHLYDVSTPYASELLYPLVINQKARVDSV